MKKWMLLVALCCALVTPVEGGKGSSSSSSSSSGSSRSSYSSGSSSKPSSSGSSFGSGKSSYSAPASKPSSSGSSFGSGKSSYSSPSATPSKPASSFGSGKSSYSSPSAQPSTPVAPPKTFGSGKSSYSSPSTTPSTPPTTFGSGKSNYTAPKAATPPPVITPTPAPTMSLGPVNKSKSDFGSDNSQAHAKSESQASFQASKEKPVSKPAAQTTNTSTPKPRTVPKERYADYGRRTDIHYHQYADRPIVVYRDNYNPFFTYWMIDHLTAHDRAMWVYHHRDTADPDRVAQLVDDKVKLELAKLEASKVAKDPNWTPTAMEKEPEVMYSKENLQVETPHHQRFWILTGLFVGGLCIAALVVYANQSAK